LLSERTVTRWAYAGGNSPAGDSVRARERALAQRLKDTLGQDAAAELDEIVGQWMCVEQDRVLTLVGTLLTHRGQPDLWHTIYRTLHESDDRADAQRFLDEQMSAVRGSRG
jgi:hypothetical protein